MARTVITKGLVFDGSGTPPRPAEVTLDGDRVVSVAPGHRDDHGTDRVIDATGCTVMPGLIESHGHLTFPPAVGHIDPSFNPPLDVSFFHHIAGLDAELARAERNARILLDAGFTSVYSAGSLLPMPTGRGASRSRSRRPSRSPGSRRRTAPASRVTRAGSSCCWSADTPSPPSLTPGSPGSGGNMAGGKVHRLPHPAALPTAS